MIPAVALEDKVDFLEDILLEEVLLLLVDRATVRVIYFVKCSVMYLVVVAVVVMVIVWRVSGGI